MGKNELGGGGMQTPGKNLSSKRDQKGYWRLVMKNFLIFRSEKTMAGLLLSMNQVEAALL